MIRSGDSAPSDEAYPEVTIERSDIDGVIVVHIDTHEASPENEAGPIMRVWLDDVPIYENPGFPGAPR